IPIYVEHSLFPLFTTIAVVGYWAVLVTVATPVSRAAAAAWRRIASVTGASRLSQPLSTFVALPAISLARRWTVALAGLLVAVAVPTAAAVYGLRASPLAPKFTMYEQLPDTPELLNFLQGTIGLRVGDAFRGSALFVSTDDQTQISFWLHGIPTVN